MHVLQGYPYEHILLYLKIKNMDFKKDTLTCSFQNVSLIVM